MLILAGDHARIGDWLEVPERGDHLEGRVELFGDRGQLIFDTRCGLLVINDFDDLIVSVLPALTGLDNRPHFGQDRKSVV